MSINLKRSSNFQKMETIVEVCRFKRLLCTIKGE
jgi:hypothetical protein